MKRFNRSAVCKPDEPSLVTESRLAMIKWSSADLQCISCSAANCKSEDPRGAVGGFLQVGWFWFTRGTKGGKKGCSTIIQRKKIIDALMYIREVQGTWLGLSAHWTAARWLSTATWRTAHPTMSSSPQGLTLPLVVVLISAAMLRFHRQKQFSWLPKSQVCQRTKTTFYTVLSK